MSAHHSFDIDLASQYGIEEAILIHHFQHWIRHNKKLNRNFHEGRYWTYQSREEIAAHFPYWTPDKIRRYMDSLLKREILIKGNFNKTPFDRTVWYAFNDEEFFLNIVNSNKIYVGPNRPMDLTKSPNPIDELAQPIPYTKPNTKTYEEHPPNPPEGGRATKVAVECFGPHIKLKKEDYENFCDEYGKTNIEQLFEEINDWISSGRGKSYKDFAAGIRTWIRRRGWTKLEKENTDFVQPKPKNGIDDEKSRRIRENKEWFSKLILTEEYRKYRSRGGDVRIVWDEQYVDFFDIPEGKYYYDGPGFRSCIQSALIKIKG